MIVLPRSPEHSAAFGTGEPAVSVQAISGADPAGRESELSRAAGARWRSSSRSAAASVRTSTADAEVAGVSTSDSPRPDTARKEPFPTVPATGVILRGIDGAVTEVRTIVLPRGQVWLTDGWEWVVGERIERAGEADGSTTAGWAVRRVDVRSGTVLWERRTPSSAVFVFPGERTLGWIGKTALELIDTDSGALRARHQVSGVDPRSAMATRDADRLYVLAEERAPSVRLAAVDQIRSGWRNRLVTGRLFALRRSDVRLLWSIAWNDAAFALDVPRQAPVLVSAFQIPAAGESRGLHRSIIRLYDARSGERVFALPGNQGDVYWSIETHPRDGWFDLLTRQGVERFRFDR
ncbi:MAG: hypothetical protein D6725_11275 [Planctomycetota bacterium]|nr:MAG: hypothetical protein D6725_11275 [Planctomycetota bacterium]